MTQAKISAENTEVWIRKRVIILKCCESCDGGYKQQRWSGYSKSVSWLDVVLADTAIGVRRLSSTQDALKADS